MLPQALISVYCLLLGAFAKLRKATRSFVLPVRPAARMEQLCSQRTGFDEIWYFIFFLKLWGENSSFVKF